MMGMHSLPAEELHGTDPFQKTMVVGYFRGAPIFMEPMITRATLMEKRSFTQAVPSVRACRPAPVTRPASGPTTTARPGVPVRVQRLHPGERPVAARCRGQVRRCVDFPGPGVRFPDARDRPALVTQPQDRLNAALSGSYRIEREVGVGGMAHRLPGPRSQARPAGGAQGAPFRAERRDGDRPVPPRDHIIAKLQHPHILPLYDSARWTDCSTT